MADTSVLTDGLVDSINLVNAQSVQIQQTHRTFTDTLGVLNQMPADSSSVAKRAKVDDSDSVIKQVKREANVAAESLKTKQKELSVAKQVYSEVNDTKKNEGKVNLETPSVSDDTLKVDLVENSPLIRPLDTCTDALQFPNTGLFALLYKETGIKEFASDYRHEFKVEKRVDVRIDGQAKLQSISSSMWFTPLIFVMYLLMCQTFLNVRKSLVYDARNFFLPVNRLDEAVDIEKKPQYRFALSVITYFNIALFFLLLLGGAGAEVSANSHIKLLLFFVAVCAYFIFREIMTRLLAFVFLPEDISKAWESGCRVLFIVLGVFLTPVVLVLSYGEQHVIAGALYTGVALMIIAFIFFLLRLTMLFFNGLYSVFYLILYLCTLEILPALALYFGLSSIIRMV